jgi:hypothetical protein
MSALPESFADLQEFADVFAVSDDAAREHVESGASLELKRRLVDTVGPRLQQINAYLDQHDDEAAWQLGSLAEATCEVALDIGWKRDPA